MDHSLSRHANLLGFAPSHATRSWPFAALSDLARATLAALAAWQHNSHSRQELARLDERMLNDAGITRAQAVVESGKFFWQR
jgi:uncharacterized protein YjiS (DUF1127 family)